MRGPRSLPRRAKTCLTLRQAPLSIGHRAAKAVDPVLLEPAPGALSPFQCSQTWVAVEVFNLSYHNMDM